MLSRNEQRREIMAIVDRHGLPLSVSAHATNLMLAGMDSLHARTLTRHKSEASFRRYTQRSMSDAAEQAFYQVMNMENED